jgi:hypothetical protein
LRGWGDTALKGYLEELKVIFSTHFFVLTLLPHDSYNHLFSSLMSKSNSAVIMEFMKQVKPVFTHLTLDPRSKGWRLKPNEALVDAMS